MIATYKARLHGNHLDWQDEAPVQLLDDAPVLVTLLPVENAAPQSRVPTGRKAAEILRCLARENPLPSISDPVAWQREIRQDRPLPGRKT